MMSKNKVIDIKVTTLPNYSITSPETPNKICGDFRVREVGFLGHAHPDRGKCANFSYNGVGRQMRTPKCAKTST